MNTEGPAVPHPIAVDFGRTRWSMVAGLGASSESAARRSLAELCRRYWVPVYAFVRRSGRSPEKAALLVQQFLSDLVLRLRAGELDAGGSFRPWLEARLEAFLAKPRSGDAAPEDLPGIDPPWPLDEIERRQQQQPPSTGPAEALQRAFALELLEIVLERLRIEAVQNGRSELFEAARPFLAREPTQDEYVAFAARIHTSPLAAVVAVKRLRQRFQELVDEELAQTVDSQETLASERHALLSVVLPGSDETGPNSGSADSGSDG